MHGASVASKPMTAEALFRLPDDNRRYALVAGELRRMSPAGFGHGATTMRVGVRSAGM